MKIEQVGGEKRTRKWVCLLKWAFWSITQPFKLTIQFGWSMVTPQRFQLWVPSGAAVAAWEKVTVNWLCHYPVTHTSTWWYWASVASCNQSQESISMQASFDPYLRLSFETALKSGTFLVLSLSKAQGGGWRNHRQRLGEGQVMVGQAVGSGCWEPQAGVLSMRTHSWLAHSSASRGIQSGAALSSWILSTFFKTGDEKSKKQKSMLFFRISIF